MRKIILYPILILLTLTGCFLDPGSSSTPKPDSSSSSPPSVLSTKTIRFDSATTKPRYLLLTNYDSSNRYVPRVTVNGSERSNDSRYLSRTVSESSIENTKLTRRFDIHFSADLEKAKTSGSRSTSRMVVEDQYSGKSVNDSNDFYVYDKNNGTSKTSFTLKLRGNITPEPNSPELFVWVDTSQLSLIPSSPDALNYLYTNFKDIYSDMNNMFGEHWGSHPFNNLLVEGNKDIHILLTDIQSDQNSKPEGYITGYFNPVDTFDKNEEPYSNQCLNLVIDSYDFFDLYRYEGGVNESWSAQSYGALIGMSTIIHEYQHMIHWYKKSITHNTNGNVFVNEMFSMTAEDLLAKKYLSYENGTKFLSPDFGRIPFFNLFWDDNSSFHWNANGVGSLNNYAMSYVMGAYLIRNYGKPYIENYFSIRDDGRKGVLLALNATDGKTHSTESLLQNFGNAVIKSTVATQTKTFNNGSLFDISGFSVKSIDFFSDTYTYALIGNEENRLYDFDKSKLQPTGKSGVYKSPFYSMSLSQLNNVHRTRNFLSESNIYVYLGELNSSDEIKIEMYDSTIQFSIVTP